MIGAWNIIIFYLKKGSKYISIEPFSKDLVNQLENKSIPLETERGYHLEFLLKMVCSLFLPKEL